MLGIEVIVEDPKTHPTCPHGPTVLFSKTVHSEKVQFFACSACRDRKLCQFYLEKNSLPKYDEKTKSVWVKQRQKLVDKINHRKSYQVLNQIKSHPESERGYCKTCASFEFSKYWNKHESHDLVKGVTSYQIEHPSEFLPPLDDAKKEAQYLFSKESVQRIFEMVKELGFSKVISVGTPRLHELIANKPDDGVNSYLMDLDSRYHSFYGPLDFCWFNAYNNYFFITESKKIFNDFIKLTDGEKLILIFDPPFGGRIELLGYTLKELEKSYQKINKTTEPLPIFLIFPYFMESHVKHSFPTFEMLDYKVDYDNHPLFQTSAPKGRKLGSPVRIFTNVDLSKISLPSSEGYKLCKPCKRWVSSENSHCKICKCCTSKDGSTYVHCIKCGRCVKPNWQHCRKCDRCATTNHKCGDLDFNQSCFHCGAIGHKKTDCPKVDRQQLAKKRKLKMVKANKAKKPKK